MKLANANSQNQGTVESTGVDVKSRDIDLNVSAPTKRRSKKRSETTSVQASSTQTIEASGSMNVKFILGVALVSIIVGVILGKRY